MAKQSGRGPKKDHLPHIQQPKHHDTYVRRAKTAGTMKCDGCGVVSHGGKWSWGDPSPEGEVHGGLCPACQRVRDRYPAGTLRLHESLLGHREEIEHMIANVEQEERAEHPLERVMSIDLDGDTLVVHTTGLHIARRISTALRRRFHLRGKTRYPEEQHRLVVDLGE